MKLGRKTGGEVHRERGFDVGLRVDALYNLDIRNKIGSPVVTL